MPKHGEQNKSQAETANSAILTKQEAAELLGCTTRYIERQDSRWASACVQTER